jgi:hypothetical protein
MEADERWQQVLDPIKDDVARLRAGYDRIRAAADEGNVHFASGQEATHVNDMVNELNELLRLATAGGYTALALCYAKGMLAMIEEQARLIEITGRHFREAGEGPWAT